ncbi:hypothetical protein M885DRAFT_542028 [Pelagophyceae sp. CCMP2097]|nr:hypothetical protein M885DRAFT_542028 [Pelagophyceae sp. CCMP2097]
MAALDARSLLRFYEEHNPQMAQPETVEHMLNAHKGDEALLYTRLLRKYGADAVKSLASDNGTAAAAAKASRRPLRSLPVNVATGTAAVKRRPPSSERAAGPDGKSATARAVAALEEAAPPPMRRTVSFSDDTLFAPRCRVGLGWAAALYVAVVAVLAVQAIRGPLANSRSEGRRGAWLDDDLAKGSCAQGLITCAPPTATTAQPATTAQQATTAPSATASAATAQPAATAPATTFQPAWNAVAVAGGPRRETTLARAALPKSFFGALRRVLRFVPNAVRRYRKWFGRAARRAEPVQ